MTTTTIHFYNINDETRCVPYLGEDPEITCDGSEGTILFDGYYYVDDHGPTEEELTLPAWERPQKYGRHLPQTLDMYVEIYKKEPYKVEKLESGGTRYHYETVKKYAHHVEIYKRVIHECTDQISKIVEDGEEMDICFFPTNLQTLYFRILGPSSDA